MEAVSQKMDDKGDRIEILQHGWKLISVTQAPFQKETILWCRLVFKNKMFPIEEIVSTIKPTNKARKYNRWTHICVYLLRVKNCAKMK